MKVKRRYKLKRKYKMIIYLIIFTNIIIYINNNDIIMNFIVNNGEKYLSNKITDIKKYNTVVHEQISNVIKLEEPKQDNVFKVENKTDNKPIIYLYNTHQTERYKRDENDKFNPSILTATSYLNELLNDKNLPTIIEDKNVSNVLKENNWKYGSSYKVTRKFMQEAKNKNDSLIYMFDIHRDSGAHRLTTKCTESKCYAKILFVIGLENENYQENQKFAENLSKRLNNKIEGLSRGILQKEGKGVNGVYNQDFSSTTLLIEVGGENNYINEVYNTISVLSEVIADYIKEEKNEQ